MISGLVGVLDRQGQTTIALLDEPAGMLRNLCSVDDFWRDPYAAVNAPATGPSYALAGTGLRPQAPRDAKVFCVGLNYREHVAEGSYATESPPPFPTLFGRWTASLSVDGVPVRVPPDEDGLDWEGEVVAWVGRVLVDASPEECLEAVFGYSVFNDITARRAQKRTSQWTLGKNVDLSGPLGPLVLAAEVGDLRQGLRLETRVNSTVVQRGNTSDMIFSVGEVLAHISRTTTLRPGDLVATGTPSGVGYARTPPWLLQDGDMVEVEVDKLGLLRTPVVGQGKRTPGM